MPILQLNPLLLLSRIKSSIKVLFLARFSKGMLEREGLCVATVERLGISRRNVISLLDFYQATSKRESFLWLIKS